MGALALTNHDRRYLRTIGRVLANEGVLTRAEFDARARPWLPTRRKKRPEGNNKPGKLLFPKAADFAFVWNQYLLRRGARA